MAGRRPVGWGYPIRRSSLANERARTLRKRLTAQEAKLWVKLRELKALGFHFRWRNGRYFTSIEYPHPDRLTPVDPPRKEEG
ncbi:MAG: DUF559 domain-containing protein [Bradyrhizobium sp.]|uniref:DUF559 domain-containing protein n=1 Tax=Bradyrhizobium sp. TaxID=376 RepID=UPI003C5F9484